MQKPLNKAEKRSAIIENIHLDVNTHTHTQVHSGVQKLILCELAIKLYREFKMYILFFFILPNILSM